MKKLGKYSLGMGDRFGRQGDAQLKAVMEAISRGVDITPVWNKSNREHMIIGTKPEDVRKEADTVTRKAGFTSPYFVDADHINIDTVDRFIESSDFFTVDVASYIGKKADNDDIKTFVDKAEKYTGELKVPGIRKPFKVTGKQIAGIAERYLFAAIKAWEIFREIEKIKGKDNFITEISMDEVPQSQTPVELFFILKMLSEENIPVQTIAPKFSGRFNKGVDYVGNPENFAKEFEADLLIIDYAVHEFGLPGDLKMSIHSGSDKFALYPHIGSIVRKHNKGFHLKTAGTTWLEEVIGLAESGGKALEFVKGIYAEALDKTEELCAPYADVIDINVSSLPSSKKVSGWDSKKFADSIRHDKENDDFNPNIRQLLHVGYKLAALKMNEYFRLLDENKNVVSKCVYENMFDRHICRLFDI